MEQMSEIARLMENGANSREAFTLYWRNLNQSSKNNMIISQLYIIWRNIPDKTPEKSDVWSTIENKDKSLEDCYWLWCNTPNACLEKLVFWEFLKKRITSTEKYNWVKKRLPKDTPRISELAILAEKTA